MTSCCVSVLPPWRTPTGAEVDPQGPDDAAEIDPAVFEEALILDGEDRVDQVLRHISHANQLPLLVIGSVVGTHQLRLQQQRTELAAGLGIAELLDGRPAESQDDVAGRLGTAGVIEGAAVQPDPPALPAEVADGQGIAILDLPIAEAHQGCGEIDVLPVEAGIENGRRRHHPRGNAKQPALESRPDDPVEMDRVARDAEAGDEADAHQDESGDAKDPPPASPPRLGTLDAGLCPCRVLPLLRFPAANPIPPRPACISQQARRLAYRSQLANCRFLSESCPMGRTRKPWGERFGEATDPVVERFSASVSFDKALAPLRRPRLHRPRPDARRASACSRRRMSKPWSRVWSRWRRRSRRASFRSIPRSKTFT